MSTERDIQCCAVHPERAASRTCQRCGNYACNECLPVDLSSSLCLSCEQLVGAARYHVVPVWRLMAMSALSFGTYELYWMYKNWLAIRRADQSNISPFFRALFSGFTYFSLLTDLNAFGINRSYAGPRLSSAIGAGYLASSLLPRLPTPWWLISSSKVLFLVPAARRIWELSSDQARSKAARWSLRHTVAGVLGLVLWGLILSGLMLAE
jgi:hypothetical protein